MTTGTAMAKASVKAMDTNTGIAMATNTGTAMAIPPLQLQL